MRDKSNKREMQEGTGRMDECREGRQAKGRGKWRKKEG